VSFLRRLLGGSPKAGTAPPSKTTTAAAGGVAGTHQSLEDLYSEFCATFCFKPGVNLMEYLKANGHVDVIDWLRWDTAEPEPKALIRLFVQTVREERQPWKMHGLTFVRAGDDGIAVGAPTEKTQQALSVLAKVMSQPIDLGYKDSPDGPWMTISFKP
jgi:hypothetical protein